MQYIVDVPEAIAFSIFYYSVDLHCWQAVTIV